MAVDCIDFEKFRMAHDLLGSKVDYRVLDVDELAPATCGRFDIVLFLGVLYHLRHPLLSLERICQLTREMAAVESFVIDDGLEAGPIAMEFYETDDLGGQTVIGTAPPPPACWRSAVPPASCASSWARW